MVVVRLNESLLNFDPSSGEDVFWQDSFNTVSYAAIRDRALAISSKFADVPRGAICTLEGFAPLEVWILMLAAWHRGLCVLPFATKATAASIDLALEQVPWSQRLQKTVGSTRDSLDFKVVTQPPIVTTSQVLILTSGSTGVPKAIAHTLESLMASAHATLKFYDWKAGDSWLMSLDPSHIGGLQILLRVWLGRGFCFYGGEPKEVANALEQRSFQYLSLVPTQLFRLLESKEARESLRKSKAILLGGAATQTSLLHEIRASSLPVSITYGSSETASQISAFAPGTFPQETGHVGQLLPIWNVSKTDDTLWISGSALMQGFWQKMKWHPVENGRFALSDQGSVEGRELYIEGRKDQLFQVGGENLAPSEILNLLEKEYSLSDLVLSALADDRFGHIPLLFIRSRFRPDINTLQSLLSSLPPIKRPREIWWLESDEVSKLSKANLEHLRQEGDALLHRLWIYEKI